MVKLMALVPLCLPGVQHTYITQAPGYTLSHVYTQPKGHAQNLMSPTPPTHPSSHTHTQVHTQITSSLPKSLATYCSSLTDSVPPTLTHTHNFFSP